MAVLVIASEAGFERLHTMTPVCKLYPVHCGLFGIELRKESR